MNFNLIKVIFLLTLQILSKKEFKAEFKNCNTAMKRQQGLVNGKNPCLIYNDCLVENQANETERECFTELVETLPECDSGFKNISRQIKCLEDRQNLIESASSIKYCDLKRVRRIDRFFKKDVLGDCSSYAGCMALVDPDWVAPEVPEGEEPPVPPLTADECRGEFETEVVEVKCGSLTFGKRLCERFAGRIFSSLN